MPLSFPGGAASSVLPSAFPLLAPNGLVGAPSYSFSGSPNTGMYSTGAGVLDVANAGVRNFSLQPNQLYILSNTGQILFGQAFDLIVARDAANILAQKNGANAQVHRVYRTTVGPEWIGFDTADAAFPIIKTTYAMANNAAAAAGTLLNAPVAGNPTKWIPVNDNGTIRNIPAW